MMQDLLFACRLWRRRPILTAAAVLTLALGSGALTAMFTVIHSVVLNPLPYANAARLAHLWRMDEGTDTRNQISTSAFAEFAAHGTQTDSVAQIRPWMMNYSGVEQPERLLSALVSPNLLDLLSARPLLGRLFHGQDENVVVLSHGFWQRRFGSDPNVSGRVMQLDGQAHTIIGVLPASFQLLLARMPTQPELYRPISLLQTGPFRQTSSLALALLKPRANVLVLTNELQRALDQTREPRQAKRHIAAVTTLDSEIGAAIRPALWILFTATAFVLLIACANLAMLMLAQVSARHKEFALRAALGASRGRLARQILGECFALAITGGLTGLLLSHWFTTMFLKLYPDTIPRAGALPSEPAVFLFAVGATLLCTLLFGALPAWRYSRVMLAESMRAGATASASSPHGAWLRDALVAVQVALTVVLLTSTGLLLRSFVLMNAVDPGFRRVNLVTAPILLSPARYKTPESQIEFASPADRQGWGVAGSRVGGAHQFDADELQLPGVDGRPHGSPSGSEPDR